MPKDNEGSKPLLLVTAAAGKTGNATALKLLEKDYKGRTMNSKRNRGQLRAALVSISAVGLVAAGLRLIAATVEPYGRIDGEGVAPLVVSTIAAQHQSGYGVLREFVGVVEAGRASRVGFELGGLVTELLVDDGDFIEARAVIAQLDTALLQSRKRELIAARDQARGAKELAELTRTRVGDALKLNAVSSQDWDEADKNYGARCAATIHAASRSSSPSIPSSMVFGRAIWPRLIWQRYVLSRRMAAFRRHSYEIALRRW